MEFVPSNTRSASIAAQTDSAGDPAAAEGGGSPGVSVGESKRISSDSPCALNRACWPYNDAGSDGYKKCINIQSNAQVNAVDSVD